MPMELYVLGGRIGALLETGMCKAVHDDMIVGPHQSLDHAIARGPAGRVEDRVVQLQKLRNRLLEHERIFGVPRQCRRTRTVDAVFIDDRFCDFLDFGVG